MIIDTVNILTTYDLKQSSLEGILDLPARKKILSDQLNTAKDIVFEENEITVKLFGTYSSKADIALMIEGLNSLVRTKQVHDLSFPTHGYTCKGVFNNGIQTQIYSLTIELTMKITVTEYSIPVVSEWDYEGVLVAGSRGSRGWVKDWTGLITPQPVQVEGLPECTGILTITTDFVLRLWVQESTYTEKAANEIEVNGTRYVLEPDGSYILESNIFTEGESYTIKLK